MDNPPRQPDIEFVAISQKQLADRFGLTIKFLTNKKYYPQSFFDFSDPTKPKPESPLFDDYSSRWGDKVLFDKLREFPTIGQGHDAWKLLRTVVPLTISASKLHAYLLMGHTKTGKRMKLKGGMLIPNKESKYFTPQFDPTWEIFYLKAAYPGMPDYPNDTISWAFMRAGVVNENCALNTFLAYNVDSNGDCLYEYKDQGSTFVTPELLQKYKLKNAITGLIILFLPFLLSASPDGLLRLIKGGQWMNCEWKAATMFLPNTAMFYALFSFFMRKDAKPYDSPPLYYVLQYQLQGFVCDTEYTIFGCWTLDGGMNVWRVERNLEFISIMFTLLMHLYYEFVCPDPNAGWTRRKSASRVGKVPIGYFTDADMCGRDIFNLYEKFCCMTEDIGRKAVLIQQIPAGFCRSSTAKTLGVTDISPPRQLTFPVRNQEVPDFITLNILRDYFIYHNAAPISESHDIDMRLKFVHDICDMSYAQFVMGGERVAMTPVDAFIKNSKIKPFAFVLTLVELIIMKGFPVDREELKRHRATQCHVLSKCEKILVYATLLLYRFHNMMKAMNMVTPKDRHQFLLQSMQHITIKACEHVLRVNATQAVPPMDGNDEDKDDIETIELRKLVAGSFYADRDSGVKDVRWFIHAMKSNPTVEDEEDTAAQDALTARNFAIFVTCMRVFMAMKHDQIIQNIENKINQYEENIIIAHSDDSMDVDADGNIM